jgi:chaperonin GroES
MALRLRPVHDLVIIKRTDKVKRTAGGLHIPDSVEDNPEETIHGEVLAVGPGRLTDHGNMIVPTVKAGDVVVLCRSAGHIVPLDGEQYLVAEAGEILAVIEGAGAS